MRKAQVRPVAVGKVRRITLKQAKSYQRSVPNGMGVTAIASVNGTGAYPGGDDYRARYAQTRSLLHNGLRSEDARAMRMCPNYMDTLGFPPAPPAPKRRPLSGAAAKSAQRKREREEAKRAAAEQVQRMAEEAARAEAEKLAAQAAAKQQADARPQRATTGRASSTSGASKMAKSKKKKKSKAKTKTKTRRTSAKRKKAPQGRKFGPFRSVRARVGKRSVRTYARATKSGASKIPTWALVGAKSAGEYSQFRKGSLDDKRAASLMKRADRLRAVREKIAADVMAGRSLFAPNARVVSYEDLMNENGRKKKKRKKAKKAKHHKGTHKRKGHKKGHSVKIYGPKLTKAQKKANSKRRTRARSEIKSIAKLLGAFKPQRNKKRTAKKISKQRKSARKGLSAVAAYFKNGYGMYDENRRGHDYDENGYGLYDENKHGKARRKRRHHKTTRRRHYEENGFADTLVGALKTGTVAVGGFLVHRALTHIIDDMVLGKVAALQSGNGAKVRPVLAGLITIAAGVPLTDIAGKTMTSEQRSMIKTGMVVSFVQGAIVSLLKSASQDKVAGYFAAYPQAYRGYGEYMATSGMGEYMATSGLGEYMATSGFGAIEQAAAGYGAIEQAAAGYGAIEQAAAGYGAIEQAAAGVGEYMATGVQGIGEYDVRAPAVYSGYGQMDDGIMPNTTAAEYALSVAEATSGIGDAGALSIVNPSDLAVPVGDGSEALRTGVLEGGDGIFG